MKKENYMEPETKVRQSLFEGSFCVSNTKDGVFDGLGNYEEEEA